jgi:hypothetical protein
MGLDRADSDNFPEKVAPFHLTATLRICLRYMNSPIELLLKWIVYSRKFNTIVHLRNTMFTSEGT